MKALLCTTLFTVPQLAAQELPPLQDMRWDRDETGELKRFYRMPEMGPEGSSPFGVLLDGNPFSALIQDESFRLDPTSLLAFFPTANRDLSSSIHVAQLYRMLDFRADLENLRRALNKEIDGQDTVARNDKLLAIRFIERKHLDSLEREIFTLCRDEDPWVRRAAEDLFDRWQALPPPASTALPPPDSVPDDWDILVYAIPGRIPEPRPLFASFWQMLHRQGQIGVRQGGSSVSPAQLIAIQDQYLLPQIRMYEVMRRFGTWRVDDLLYCIDGVGDSNDFLLFARGEFEAEKMTKGLVEEGRKSSDLGGGNVGFSGGLWGFQLRDDYVQVQNKVFESTSSPPEAMILDADMAAVAILDFEALQPTVPWLGHLGSQGSIKLGFDGGRATLLLESDGDAAKLDEVVKAFAKEREEELEEAEKLIGRANAGAAREYFGNMLMTHILYCRESLLHLLQKVVIRESEQGLSAQLELSSADLSHIAPAWYAVLVYGEF